MEVSIKIGSAAWAEPLPYTPHFYRQMPGLLVGQSRDPCGQLALVATYTSRARKIFFPDHMSSGFKQIHIKSQLNHKRSNSKGNLC